MKFMPKLSNSCVKVLAALGLAASLTACGQQPKTYTVTPDAAKEALVDTTIPDIAFGKAAHGAPAVATETGVAWSIQAGASEDSVTEGASRDRGTADRSGHEIMVLTAALVPLDGRTQVTVNIESPEGGDPDGARKLDKQKPQIANLWRSIAREQVDAVLTHRKFEFANIQGGMAVAIVSELPNISKQADNAVKASERQEIEKIHDAYRAAGGDN